ncbi:hypothetical protein R84B8_01254 [Treponema sp. R8-4-B8]
MPPIIMSNYGMIAKNTDEQLVILQGKHIIQHFMLMLMIIWFSLYLENSAMHWAR